MTEEQKELSMLQTRLRVAEKIIDINKVLLSQAATQRQVALMQLASELETVIDEFERVSNQ